MTYVGVVCQLSQMAMQSLPDCLFGGGQHPQGVALQATCNQPEAGQDRHRRGCMGLKPRQHTQSPPYSTDNRIVLLFYPLTCSASWINCSPYSLSWDFPTTCLNIKMRFLH